jgi:dipeptidyl aminopeptidase/acylaminoacyl peptidase
MRRWLCWSCVVVVLLAGSPAQGQGTRADYERAAGLSALFQNKVFRSGVYAHWFADSTRFWYRNDLADGARDFVMVDAVKGTRVAAFDHERLARALAKQTGKEIRAAHLPFSTIEPSADGEVIRFRAEGKNWRLERHSGELKEEPAPTKAKEKTEPATTEPVALVQDEPRRGRSPDGKWIVLVKNHNLVLRDREKKDEISLSSDGKAEDGYGEPVFWSPDSRRVVALRTQAAAPRKVTLVESSPRNQLQPRVQTIDYPKPGDPLPISKPHLFDVAARKEIPISDELFPHPWSIEEMRWQADSSRFTFVYNQRGHQVLRLIAVDAATGKARAIIDEQSKTFIDYAHKQYLYALENTGELIWMSERDGWNHLYLYDGKTGKVKNQITTGKWVVRAVKRVDEAKRQVWFQAGGIHPEQDPYHIHLCRVNLDGSGLVKLTEGDGTHEVSYSPDRRFLIDTYSRVDLAPVTELRRAEGGRLVCELERADVTALEAAGWRPPERFVARGRDGTTDIYGVIHRPRRFDAKKKYPVIEAIYAGPQGAFVPKRFQTSYPAQQMTELGFIVVQIDGMGTSHRSKAFHDVCWKNLGDSGFPDRIAWIKAAAAKYPSLDLTRVGIYGTSAGGQSSLRGLLAHGDFYHVGVSICGCHDNRMDKVWWNELWMGWPVGPHYREQSNVVNAHKLTGKLLLIVGELDRNVDPASTMQVVNALIRANKDFDLLVIPGGGHGNGGAYGLRREQDFFVRHLLGVEPRSNP